MARDMNNVPMQGMGKYSSNASLQHAAMLKALPLLQKAAQRGALKRRASPEKHITIIEYGSAHGNNSIRPMEEVLWSTAGLSRQFILCDRPENDFVTLSHNINTWHEDSDRNVSPVDTFFSMVPRSFYQKVVPSGTVDVGFSLACLHHLEETPPGLNDLSEDQRRELLQTQSGRDLRRFLQLRADEMRRGGMLAVSFVSQASSGRENYAGLVDACRSAMVNMVQSGELPLAAAKAFAIPTYDRTMEDVQDVLKELSGLWTVHDVFESGVIHPAMELLELAKGCESHGQASEDYASTVVDWLMAVCSGYFLKAVGQCSPDISVAEASVLLDKWACHTKTLFLKEHRDEEVFCSFIYLLLGRV